MCCVNIIALFCVMKENTVAGERQQEQCSINAMLMYHLPSHCVLTAAVGREDSCYSFRVIFFSLIIKGTHVVRDVYVYINVDLCAQK